MDSLTVHKGRSGVVLHENIVSPIFLHNGTARVELTVFEMISIGLFSVLFHGPRYLSGGVKGQY